MNLTKEQIKYFIENYGNDDVYYAHHYEGADNQFLIVEFFQHLGKMVSPENIGQAIKDLEKSKAIPQIIVLTKNGARILNDDTCDRTLEKNYKEFLNDLKNENNLEK